MKPGLKIRILRHGAGLDQYQAAGLLQISVAAYSRIETGRDPAGDGLFERLTVLFARAQG